MAFQEFVGTLTIAAGSAASNVISGSSIDKFEELTIFPPATQSAGNPVFQIASDILDINSFRLYTDKTRVSVQLSYGTASFFETPACDAFRLSGSIQTASLDYKVYGSYDVKVHTLP